MRPNTYSKDAISATEQKKQELLAELKRVEEREARMRAANALARNQAYQKATEDLKRINGELHQIRIRQARKRTSIEVHQRKIKEREREIAKLEVEEAEGVEEQKAAEERIQQIEASLTDTP